MSVEFGGLQFERLGHSSVRIETDDGTVLYVDPWSEVLGAETPGDADVVLVSHDDYDHYDPDAIEAVSTPETVVVAFEGVDTSDLDPDLEVVFLPDEGTVSAAGIDVQGVPAYNDPDGPHVRDTGEPFHARGEVNGLLFAIDGTRVYYPSDTDLLPEHGNLVVDVLVPPIGGSYTMDRHGAAELARSVGADLVLPVHYGTEGIEGLDADAEAFAEELRSDGIRTELF